MYGYGYRYNSGLVVGAGGGAPFANTKSLSFDGVDDYVIAPLDGTATGGILPAVDSDVDLTISIWFKKNTTSSMFQWADTLTSGIPMVLIAGTSTGYRILLNNAYQFTGVVAIGDWVNVIIIRNSSTNVWTHYLNGVALQTYNDGGTIARRLNATDIYLGNGYSSYFNGFIDEVSIFNTDQSANVATLSTAPTIDLTDLNPIAWYRNGDNGSWKSPQWLIPNNENKDKVSNYSFQLDGVDDYVDLNRPTELISATNFSISCWFKTPLNALQGLFTWFSGASGWIELNCSTDGSMVANLTRLSSATYGIASAGTITANTWNNVVMVFDGGGAANADRLKLYINGSLITFASFSGTIPTQTGTMLSSGLHVGERYNGVNYFNGNIDSYSIFSNSLTQQNVTDIYNGGTPTTLPSGAVAHYKMGEEATFIGGVWTVPDQVGSNDGTSNAMTIEDRVGDAPNSENNALSLNMDEVDRTTDVPT